MRNINYLAEHLDRGTNSGVDEKTVETNLQEQQKTRGLKDACEEVSCNTNGLTEVPHMG